MAERDIIQNMITRLGQSQLDRLPRELGGHFADLDERSTEDLLQFAGKLAPYVNFYTGQGAAPSGDWTTFFPSDPAFVKKLQQNPGPDTPPHLALFMAFLELFKVPLEKLNSLTGRHLEFYYRDVLRLSKRDPLPDRVHLLLELKKGSVPTAITPGHLFSAGKDDSGAELFYAPARETVLNCATVASVRSLFLDGRGRGTVRYAPVADSVDGIGGKPADSGAKWQGFGNESLPVAETGFALASPILRMHEGIRTVTVTLELKGAAGSSLTGAGFREAFDLYLTGEKSWLGPYPIRQATISGEELTFDFTVPAAEHGVVDYDARLHGYRYGTAAPVLKLLLKEAGPSCGYRDFLNIFIISASVAVEVDNITNLTLESDLGSLDPKKAFQPFGPVPTVGSRFLVGCPEALEKKLAELSITVQWKGVEPDLGNYYSGYNPSVGNGSFTASVSFRDGGGWEMLTAAEPLFNDENAAALHTFTFKRNPHRLRPLLSQQIRLSALTMAGSHWALRAVSGWLKINPVHRPPVDAQPKAGGGFVTFSLNHDFLHSAYRKQYVERVLQYAKTATRLNPQPPTLMNEPYTPSIGSISLSYKTGADAVVISSTAMDDFADPGLQFFHNSYFGQMREHGYQRAQLGLPGEVPLLPAYGNKGEMLVGLSGLHAGDSVSLLFQVAEGSADPELPREEITWSVLCDNYWQPLRRDGVVLDTTGGLLASGIITFIIPEETTTDNTILPAGMIWLKGGVAGSVRAVCQLIKVAANGVEARFMDSGNSLAHLSAPLPAARITRMKNGPSAVKTVSQPYSSFGGRPSEPDDVFRTRVAERLRHKERCITAWDYERLVLGAFPELHKVKCIPHAKFDSWLAPGNVMLVVVPDLRNCNAVDPLQPKVRADLLARIYTHLRGRCSEQVNLHVKNPAYQQVRFDFRVRFRGGFEFNFFSGRLNEELVRYLSPWAFAPERDISFGSRIYRSVALDFVEKLPYVDFVTDFRMYSYFETAPNTLDIDEAAPRTPDAILVSAAGHSIGKVI
jgi:hypothetical protein